MKRNQKSFALLLAAVLALFLFGCGANAKGSDSTAVGAPIFNTASSQETPEESMDYSFEAPASGVEPNSQIAQMDTGSAGGIPSEGGGNTDVSADLSEKIIYNSEVTLETTEFDAALEKIAQLVKDLGGYMESTSISGSNYTSIVRGNAGTRSAYYEIRIPSANFSQLNSDLSALGNVPHNRTYTKNITTQYYDAQSRLNAYKVQEDRLLEMLTIADTVEDMLSIQQQLTEVQYEIDSLTGTLRYYDNQVSYSTVDLTVEEVREYTPSPTVTLTYWERMRQEFGESLHDTGRFFTEGFLWLVTSLPWLLPFTAAAVAVIWLLRRRIGSRAKRAEKKAAKRAERMEKCAGKQDSKPETPSLPERENEDQK